MKWPLIPTLVSIAVAAGLAACAGQEHWQHPQTGTAMVEKDLADCSDVARRESWRTPTSDPFIITRYAGVPYGQPPEEPARRYSRNPYAHEERLRDYCMREKGYELVATPQQHADAQR